MDTSYWIKQTDKPLYPELEWSRPETKALSGKLLIIGGSSAGFSAPAESYGLAEEAGVGTVRVLLPENLHRSVSKLFPAAEYAPSTPSGSFSTSALAEWCDAGDWADAVLLPGDLSRNSETSMLLENFLEKYAGKITLTREAADVMCQQPISILQRSGTLLVLSLNQLRQLGTESHFARPFTSEMGILLLIQGLHEFTKRYSLCMIVKHQGYLVYADRGKVSTTKCADEKPMWQLQVAARASVWWLQHTNKQFEAITASLYS